MSAPSTIFFMEIAPKIVSFCLSFSASVMADATKPGAMKFTRNAIEGFVKAFYVTFGNGHDVDEHFEFTRLHGW